jgi:4,5:9,10-diseco-3-hydroxy-5,9,17-trioxoandrosta-1(10),2-diene-4-oate hydrolase
MQNITHRQVLIDMMDVPVKQHQISIGSIKTAYLSAGDGFPIICLHGAGAGAVTWYPCFKALARKYHVIAPDIVGYGESDKPDAVYDRPYFAAWLNEFIAALNITKTHVIGTSQGGAIALQYALTYPEVVEKLVLAAAGGLGGKASFLPLLSMCWLNCMPSRIANYFFSRYLLVNPENRATAHAEYSLEVLKMVGGKNPFIKGQGKSVAPFSKDELEKVQHQTLILWGDKDRLFPIEQIEATSQLIPNARLKRIQNAGHMLMLDQPEIFNKTVLNFLED